MSEALIGLRVSVVLIFPGNQRIEGRVANVQDRQLFLENTFYPQTQAYGKPVVIPGQHIADIEVVKAAPPASTPLEELRRASGAGQTGSSRSVTPLSVQPNGHQVAGRGVIQSKGLADPAILSFAKPPVLAPQELAVSASSQGHQRSGLPVTHTENKPDLTATLSKPFNNLSLGGVATAKLPLQAVAAKGHGTSDENSPAKSKRRRHKKRPVTGPANDEDSSPELSRPKLAFAQDESGWRQDPLLVKAPKAGPAVVPAIVTKKQKPKRQKAFGAQMDDGFITEEATDIQAMDDFDFVGNLSKFDKKAVFEKLRSEDTTADADLLVSHNRISRPGTFEGTKLHPFENVLQSQRRSSKEAYDSDEDYDTVDALGSRPPYQASSRSSSKRRPVQRNASKMSDSSQQRNDSVRTRGRDSLTGTGASPKPTSQASLRYLSGRLVPCVWPDDLKDAEDLALSEDYWLTEDIIAENAGRSIAALAISTISPDGRRFAPGNHNTKAVVVILVWDERTAAKALAAGRHLQSRGVRVIASAADKRMIHYEDEDTALAAQLYRLKGSLMSWDDTATHLKTLDAPPELIIDALSGSKDLMSGLLNNEEPDHVKTAAFQMMAWANKSRASCLAIDCPFGVHPNTGVVQVHEGEPAEIRAKVVVSCGAPVNGILAAQQTRHHEGVMDEWRICICDTGINPALKQITRDRMGRGYGRGIAFGSDWIVKARFESPDAP